MPQKPFQSVAAFRCSRCADRPGLAKQLWLVPTSWDQDDKSVGFAVECFNGHISFARFRYVDEEPGEPKEKSS
jgi:hypothetical protein